MLGGFTWLILCSTAIVFAGSLNGKIVAATMAPEVGDLVIAAANRDGTRWTDAERFDPTRARRRPMTFGLGPHACPGGPPVRLQATAALRAAQAYDLLGRFGADARPPADRR